MDAFFAAVEQRDFPELRGQPVVVGGQPNSRGVVATCSYEAREFGIHSAMPSSRAHQLCPQAIFLRPRFSAYKQASAQIHQVFRKYTKMIEPLSLDEAYLDVTESVECEGSATRLAGRIRSEIFSSTGLTASAGISYNKFLAKLASDQNKPNGQYVIRPGEAEAFLNDLAIGRFYGIGKVTEKKMQAVGIYTGGDLRSRSLLFLQKNFGNSAEYYYNISRGIDQRPVSPKRLRKSLGSETTFQQDLSEVDQMLEQLLILATEVIDSLCEKNLLAHTVTIKVKYADFSQVTRSYTSDSIVSVKPVMRDIIPALLAKTEVRHRKVRLLGVSFSNLLGRNDMDHAQLTLF